MGTDVLIENRKNKIIYFATEDKFMSELAEFIEWYKDSITLDDVQEILVARLAADSIFVEG